MRGPHLDSIPGVTYGESSCLKTKKVVLQTARRAVADSATTALKEAVPIPGGVVTQHKCVGSSVLEGVRNQSRMYHPEIPVLWCLAPERNNYCGFVQAGAFFSPPLYTQTEPTFKNFSLRRFLGRDRRSLMRLRHRRISSRVLNVTPALPHVVMRNFNMYT